MGWMSFVAAIARALAWPALVLVAVLVFRTDVRQLLGRGLRRFKAGPLEAEWETVVADTREAVASGGVASQEDPVDWRQSRELASSLLDRSPSVAVLTMFQPVEHLLVQAVPPSPDGTRIRIGSLSRYVERAMAEGRLSPGIGQAILGLRRLRNLAVHDPREVTKAMAEEFIVLAEPVLTTLEATIQLRDRQITAADTGH